MTKIKICGITREKEICWLNAAKVDYAGFVFFEKSKRFISIPDAKRLSEKLNSNIKKVAVTVSPGRELVEQIEQAGFDILQIHGDYDREILKGTRLSVWVAVNLSGIEQMERWQCTAEDGIDAILFDAGDFGSGKTFGWEQETLAGEQQSDGKQGLRWRTVFSGLRTGMAQKNMQFILAGGLHSGNVAEGMRLFSPDVVDVSSGVEEITGGKRGKSKEKIMAFTAAVRAAEESVHACTECVTGKDMTIK